MGVMERPYMSFLVETHYHSIELGGKSTFVALPDLSQVKLNFILNSGSHNCIRVHYANLSCRMMK
jgi:hypothetical protein